MSHFGALVALDHIPHLSLPVPSLFFTAASLAAVITACGSPTRGAPQPEGADASGGPDAPPAPDPSEAPSGFLGLPGTTPTTGRLAAPSFDDLPPRPPGDPVGSCVGEAINCAHLPEVSPLTVPRVSLCPTADARPIQIMWRRALGDAPCSVPPCTYRLPRLLRAENETVYVLADVVSAYRDQVLGYRVWRYDVAGNVVTEFAKDEVFSPVLAPTSNHSSLLVALPEELFIQRTLTSHYRVQPFDVFVERLTPDGTPLEALLERFAVDAPVVLGTPVGDVLIGDVLGSNPDTVEVARYNADGALIYNQNGLARYGYFLGGLAPAPDGSALVFTGNALAQCVVLSLSPVGNVEWARSSEAGCNATSAWFDGPGYGWNGRIYHRGPVVAPDGAAYVPFLHSRENDDGELTMAVQRILPDGTSSWEAITSTSSEDRATSLSTDADGNAWISQSFGPEPWTALVFRLTPDGQCTVFESGMTTFATESSRTLRATLVFEPLAGGRLFYANPATSEIGVLTVEP